MRTWLLLHVLLANFLPKRRTCAVPACAPRVWPARWPQVFTGAGCGYSVSSTPHFLGLWAPLQIDPFAFCCHKMLTREFDNCIAFHVQLWPLD